MSSAEAPEAHFEFGRNWEKFLEVIDDERVGMARDSLRSLLGVSGLEGKSFLDAGSGSGLFSLAAAELGADVIFSFDYDPRSVACTRELKRRYHPELGQWTVQSGDCLNRDFLAGLPRFDVVYSWGVLHHTGQLWRALENVMDRVKAGGLLCVAVYNDQGWQSRAWRSVKRFHQRGAVERALVIAVFVPVLIGIGCVSDLVNLRDPTRRYREPAARGMSVVRDWFDWLGGYPFEVARPEEVFRFLRDRGFVMREMRTAGGGWGCNEFVFERASADDERA